jgi:hypothetical protein
MLRLSYCGRLRVLVAVILVVAGALLIGLRWVQGSGGMEAYYAPSPTLYSGEVVVKLGEGPEWLLEAFRKAVRDWDGAVAQFNSIRDFRCSLSQITGCRSCLFEPKLPRISITEEGGYNVLVVFMDEMPAETVIAYTEYVSEGSILARVVVWKGIPERRAYQVAIHEISRLYGIGIPEVYRTLFGAVPAGSNTVKLNPSLRQFMEGPPDPMKPTTLDLNAALEALKNPGGGVYKMEAGTVFRAYDEPDFTLPALASPALIVSGLYILSRGWRYAG